MTAEVVAPVCWGCVVGLHEECIDPQLVSDAEADINGPWTTCCCSVRPSEEDDEEEKLSPGRPLLPVDQITDIYSTGRRRTQKMYPIWPKMTCEWAGLRYAGGGVNPIVGCQGNIIAEAKRNADLPEWADSRADRHHGPDKNVLNLEPGNVHRICSSCHNYWHAKNNSTYSGTREDHSGQPWLPDGDWLKHDPITKATEEELELAAVERKLTAGGSRVDDYD